VVAPSPPCWKAGQGLLGLGGNFAMATPDTPLTFKALQSCELTVHIATKLNRSHLIHGRKALILPTLGRTEIDLQNGVPQGVTVEDSMSMVHISYGMNKPASPDLLSEIAIVRAWPRPRWAAPMAWKAYRDDYAASATISKSVRRLLRLQRPRGQAGRLPPESGLARARMDDHQRQGAVRAAEDRAGYADPPRPRQYGERLMVMMTTRSHDQYNTTIYGDGRPLSRRVRHAPRDLHQQPTSTCWA
jgi:anaerobic selenocysteine-containing dehydrogenase